MTDMPVPATAEQIPVADASAQALADAQAEIAQLKAQIEHLTIDKESISKRAESLAANLKVANLEIKSTAAEAEEAQMKLREENDRLRSMLKSTAGNVRTLVQPIFNPEDRQRADDELGLCLTEGWSPLNISVDLSMRRVVTLHRAQPAPAPQPRYGASFVMPPVPPVPRAVTGTVLGVDGGQQPQPVASAVHDYVHSILRDKSLTADERNQRLTAQAILNVQQRHAERAAAGSLADFRPITTMEMAL